MSCGKLQEEGSRFKLLETGRISFQQILGYSGGISSFSLLDRRVRKRW